MLLAFISALFIIALNSFKTPTIKTALELEETKPADALHLYDRFDERNRKLYVDILLLAIVCPVAASIIAFFVIHSTAYFHTLITLLILSIVGYGPAILLYEHRQAQGARFRHFGLRYIEHYGLPHERYDFLRRLHVLSRLVISLVYTFIGGFLVLLWTVIFSALFIIPVSFLLLAALSVAQQKFVIELPFYLKLPINLFGSLLGAAVCFSKIRAPVFPIKNFLSSLIVDVKLGMKDVLDNLAGIGMSLVLVGAGPLGLLYDHLYQGVLASGFTGALLGLSLYRPEKDFILGFIIKLGRIRCFLRLNRNNEARYWINDIAGYSELGCPKAVRELAEILSRIEDRRSGRARDSAPSLAEMTMEARSYTSMDEPYRDIWLSSVLRTYSLAGVDVVGIQ